MCNWQLRHRHWDNQAGFPHFSNKMQVVGCLANYLQQTFSPEGRKIIPIFSNHLAVSRATQEVLAYIGSCSFLMPNYSNKWSNYVCRPLLTIMFTRHRWACHRNQYFFLWTINTRHDTIVKIMSNRTKWQHNYRLAQIHWKSIWTLPINALKW